MQKRLGFAFETARACGSAGNFLRQELQGNKAVQPGVLGLVDHTHTAAAEFLDDAVVRNGLADERVGGWHVEHILGRARNQVNEAQTICVPALAQQERSKIRDAG